MGGSKAPNLVSRTEALKLSGLSDRTFRRREAAGEIVGELHGQEKYYHPDACLKLAQIDAAETESIQERSQLLSALKTSQDHTEQLLKLVTDPARTANKHYQKLVSMMSKRQRKMDRRFMRTMDLVETVVGAQHERELDVAREERRSKTAAEGLEIMKTHLPRLLDGVARVNRVKDFFNSLDEDRVAAMATADEDGNGFLNPHQRKELLAILDSFKGKGGDDERDEDGTEDGTEAEEEARARSVREEGASVSSRGRGATAASGKGSKRSGGRRAAKPERPDSAGANGAGSAGGSGNDSDGATERTEGVKS
jgi:hypothetical protein